MAYENLRLGVSPLTKTVFAGRVNKKGDVWVDRKDVTQDRSEERRVGKECRL